MRNTVEDEGTTTIRNRTKPRNRRSASYADRSERTRQELEPFLVEAMDSRKKLSAFWKKNLRRFAARVI